MATNPQHLDDPNHFDGVWIGHPVPMSVFYKGRRPGPTLSFMRTVTLAIQEEQARQRESERLRKAAQRRFADKKKPKAQPEIEIRQL